MYKDVTVTWALTWWLCTIANHLSSVSDSSLGLQSYSYTWPVNTQTQRHHITRHMLQDPNVKPLNIKTTFKQIKGGFIITSIVIINVIGAIMVVIIIRHESCVCVCVRDCACVRACVSCFYYLFQMATMKIRNVCVLFDQMYTCMSNCATFYK